MQKIDWINGQAGGTPLSAENLNQMEDYIESEFNNQAGDIEDIGQEVEGIKTMISNETKIGKWINGDDLYRKIINIGSLPNATTKQIAHSIQNLGVVTRLYGIAQITSSGVRYPLPFTGEGSQYNVGLRMDNTNIIIVTGIDRTGFNNNYVIIEYTKTA